MSGRHSRVRPHIDREPRRTPLPRSRASVSAWKRRRATSGLGAASPDPTSTRSTRIRSRICACPAASLLADSRSTHRWGSRTCSIDRPRCSSITRFLAERGRSVFALVGSYSFTYYGALNVVTIRSSSRALLLALASLAALACGSDDATQPVAPGFLGGTASNHEIGLVVNSTGKAVTLFQLGSPATQKTIAFGASTTISPVGLSVRGRRAAVPLGNAASIALIDLVTQTATRFFTFASGNATGSAFVDDTTIIVANPT